MRNSELFRALRAVEVREQRLLAAPAGAPGPREALYQKVPPALRSTLEAAFAKAFSLLFLQGTGLIEKTFDRTRAQAGYTAGNAGVDSGMGPRALRQLDRQAGRHNLLNTAATTATGLGLGALGFGLPDIPLLVGTLLKGIYEIGLGYGFDYTSEEERRYILRLCRAALADGPERAVALGELNTGPDTPLDGEVAATAAALAQELLVEKFVQGIPVVGVVGGVVNLLLCRRILALAGLQYKKRYILGKLRERGLLDSAPLKPKQ